SRCSRTMRTARSRTSAENLLDLFMAPFSQELEPPPNPGRFIQLSSKETFAFFVSCLILEGRHLFAPKPNLVIAERSKK
ncbi:hypothetical protein, partial [Paraburkholderia tagetis]